MSVRVKIRDTHGREVEVEATAPSGEKIREKLKELVLELYDEVRTRESGEKRTKGL